MIVAQRYAWPAIAIMGIGLLNLALILKAAQANMPLQPPWIMAVIVCLYVSLALIAQGFSMRAFLLLGAMIAAHSVFALLMGWGYSAVEGVPRAWLAAWQHGLWNYLPGTALQFGFACFVAIMLDLWLDAQSVTHTPSCATLDAEDSDDIAYDLDIAQAPDLSAALGLAASIPGIAGVLAANESLALASGIWAADPIGAWKRVHGLAQHFGNGLDSLPLGEALLLFHMQDKAVVAMLISSQITPVAAHNVLRELWSRSQKEWTNHEEA